MPAIVVSSDTVGRDMPAISDRLNAVPPVPVRCSGTSSCFSCGGYHPVEYASMSSAPVRQIGYSSHPPASK